jgi:hypothetical protein
MRSKLLASCVLAIGLLLGASSNVYADTISVTSVSLTNIQLISSSGTVLLSSPQSGSPTAASGAAENSFGQEVAAHSESPTRAQAAAVVISAGASGQSDLVNLQLNANSNVMLTGCVCSAESEGLAFLRQSFTIAGGTGSVDLNFLCAHGDAAGFGDRPV